MVFLVEDYARDYYIRTQVPWQARYFEGGLLSYLRYGVLIEDGLRCSAARLTSELYDSILGIASRETED